MRLSGQFQVCLFIYLFILRKDFERTRASKPNHSLRTFCPCKKPLPLLFFVCLFLLLLVGFGGFAFLYAQNFFVKRKTK